MGRGLAAAAAALTLAVGASGSSGSPPVTGWTTFGNSLGRTSAAAGRIKLPASDLWAVKLPGRVTSQPIVVRGAPGTGRSTVYVATSAGVVQAFADTGRELWRAQVGRLVHQCKQLNRYGVTGTPVADAATRSLYVADALGRLHALSLDTGKERPGWPVRLFTDFREELVWGALTAVRGSIYLGTGSYCDAPMVGRLFRVNVRTRAVSHWDVVPEERGGGGGVWGFGGIAYSTARGSLFAVTGNAFRGGSNDGDAFREWEPYGEHLVELSLSFQVRAASHPRGLTAPDDLDFVGSPVLVSRPGCPEQVVALNKNSRLYAWKASGIADGPSWSLQLSPLKRPTPVVSQVAYSRAMRSLFVTISDYLVKIGLTSSCSGKIAWRQKEAVIQSTPTVAGTTVWTVNWHSGAVLIATDGRTGRLRGRVAVGKDYYLVGPAVLDGKLYLGSFGGLVRALQ